MYGSYLRCVVAIAGNKIEDVRTVLQHYNQFDDPMAEFRKAQAAVLVSPLPTLYCVNQILLDVHQQY